MNTWIIGKMWWKKVNNSGKITNDTKDSEVKLAIFSTLLFLGFSTTFGVEVGPKKYMKNKTLFFLVDILSKP